MTWIRRRIFGLIMSNLALLTHLGFIYQTDNASETEITDTTSFFNAVFSGTTLGIGRSFDSPASGQLRYISPIARDVIVMASISVIAAGANQKLRFDFAINSIETGKASVDREVGPVGDKGAAMVLMAETLSQNDIVTLCVKNTSSINNITVVNLQLVAAAIPT